MKKSLCFSIAFLFIGVFAVFAQDPIFNTVKTELNRNFEILKLQPIPAYYCFARLDDSQYISATANLGALQSKAKINSPNRILSMGMRVGDYNLDNSHEIRESGWNEHGISVSGTYLPYEDNDRVLKTNIWEILDDLYNSNVQNYERIKANLAVKVEQEDKSPDFSKEKVENYYEEPIDWNTLNINPKVLEDKVKMYSAIFDNNDDVNDGVAIIAASLNRMIFVDTEGREIAENRIEIRLFIAANVIADDGMYLPLFRSWEASSISELPSDEEVIAATKNMSVLLSELKKAPVVESFTGPAILSPETSGVFFHEIFGHRIEGSRLKQETDAQTFKKKIGEKILPSHISVTFDPTQKYFNNQYLLGNYKFDDEGVRGQRVEVVKNGILKNFLMSRTPIEGFSNSNGHGRASIGYGPISRQSNMFIESSQKYSEAELFKKLRNEAKKQGKEYAYYFKEVSNGFTNTSRYSPNAFNVTPLVVYRVYVDGRPNELVRGVDMVGTPLAMFSQIEACGSEYAIFNGECGAESGNIPVSCISPALFVKQIETQKRAKSHSQPPLLPKPKTSSDNTNLSENETVLKAIQEEVDRGLQNLHIDGLQSPFFIAYTISDIKSLTVTASLGSLMSSDINNSRYSGTRLLIGDYKCSDENFIGTGGSASSYDGSPTIENDNEQAIRNTVWKDLDAIYKRAAETYEQKIAAIKQLEIPAEELELPDWDKTPVVVMTNLPKQELDFNNKAKYEAYTKEASKVFADYKNIYDSRITLQLIEATIYFYNTEGTKFIYPINLISLNGSASGRTEEGEEVTTFFVNPYATLNDLPSIDDFKKECKTFAERLLAKTNAPKLKESYSGPVLFEDKAVANAFTNNFFYGSSSLIASRRPISADGYSYGGNGIEEMMNKRITAREISIEDLTGTKEYNGVKLLGYAPIDADGVIPPEKITLVEKGILKNLLNDRVPTAKAPHSNGHNLFDRNLSNSTSFGVARLTYSNTKSNAELRKELLERAIEEGYEYAYIVKAGTETRGYSFDIYRIYTDGREELLRSAVINNFDAQCFKRIVAASDKEVVHNYLMSTVISPSAVLFEELEIRNDRVDNFRKPPLVPHQ
ncbi:putative Zn-dependent protease [Dysgonomonadaceae bacterium PH5-43]|nr:putative Zn-dependent protease [Dysgonomonadaceae bacterium PH5-43]